MKESYQREECCSDQRKGSLRHFQPSEEFGVKLQGREAPRVVIRSQFIGLLTKTTISLPPAGRILSVIAMFQQPPHWAWGTVTKVTLPFETLPKQHNSDAAITGESTWFT